MASEEITVSRLLLIEYEQIRAEQRNRVGSRNSRTHLVNDEKAGNLTAFCLSIMITICIYRANGPLTTAFMVLSVLETVTVIGFAVQIARYAELERESAASSAFLPTSGDR